MADVPENYLFTEDHEWAKIEGDLLVIGISDYAQENLGDIVFVDLHPAGETISAGDSFGTIESVKAAEDLYLPVTGTVDQINESLADAPDSINKEPYDAWLVKLKDFDQSALEQLMDSAAYRTFLESL